MQLDKRKRDSDYEAKVKMLNKLKEELVTKLEQPKGESKSGSDSDSDSDEAEPAVVEPVAVKN